MSEVPVKQPPAVAPKLGRAARKDLARFKKQHKAAVKAAKGRIRDLSRQARAAGFGRRLSAQNAKTTRQEIKAIRAQIKQAKKQHQLVAKLQRNVLANHRYAIKQMRQSKSQAKKRARSLRNSLRQNRTRGGLSKMSRQSFRSRSRGQSLAWVMKALRLAVKKKSGMRSVRNRGFTKSGKGFQTGRAGSWK